MVWGRMSKCNVGADSPKESGYYWSASLDTNAPGNAYRFVFQSETVNSHDRTYRCYGNAVRPVVNR